MKKIKIKTENLLSVLEPLSNVINPGHTVPVLRAVKLEFKKYKLQATGENLEINCVNTVDVAYSGKEKFCVDFTMLLSVLKSITDKVVNIILEEGLIYIEHKKGDFKLPCEQIKEFPTPAKEAYKNSAKISGKKLKSALKVANKFVLDDNLDPVANISLSVGKNICIRSTNKITLFEEVFKGTADPGEMLINGKSSTALHSLLEDEDLTMHFNESKIYFKFKQREVTVVQQHGDFPIVMFNKIIKTIKQADNLKVDFDEFTTALKRTGILANKEKDHAVRFGITKKQLELSCENKGMSSKSQELIDAEFSKGMVIGYNVRYLTEVLSVFDKSSEFFINAQNCFCIKSKNKKGIIAPVGLGENG